MEVLLQAIAYVFIFFFAGVVVIAAIGAAVVLMSKFDRHVKEKQEKRDGN